MSEKILKKKLLRRTFEETPEKKYKKSEEVFENKDFAPKKKKNEGIQAGISGETLRSFVIRTADLFRSVMNT